MEIWFFFSYFCFFCIIDWYAMWHEPNEFNVYGCSCTQEKYVFSGENIGFGWMNKNNEIKSIEQKKYRELHHLILMILNGTERIALQRDLAQY